MGVLVAMGTNKTAAIYARISKDRMGAGLGVERQTIECRELADQLGWQISVIFTDNDISAYSGKPRPGYLALLQAIEDGSVTGVLAWHTDRLHRSPIELEHYVTLLEAQNVPTQTVKAGPLDLASPTGRLMARQMAAFARYEVEHMIERGKAAKLQAAKAGKWGGGLRPFGYESDGMTVCKPEADIIKELAARVIAGESFRQCALDLNARHIPTSGGKDWNALKVRNVLIRKRNAGIRAHHDAEYDAAWPAILDAETWEQMHEAIAIHRLLYKQRGPYRKYLLKGFAFCGSCDTELHSGRKQGRDGSYSSLYRCTNKPIEGQHGCGLVSRSAAPLEDLITEAVLYRLDSPDFRAALAQQNSDSPRLRSLLADQHRQQQRLQQLIEDYANGLFAPEQFASAKATADERLTTLATQLASASSTRAIHALPLGDTLRTTWQAASLDWKRQVIASLIDKVHVDPRPYGAKRPRYKSWSFDVELVRVDWRV